MITEAVGEYNIAAARSAPPLSAAATYLAGYTLQDWVLVATLVYTLLQIFLLVRKYVKDRKNGS